MKKYRVYISDYKEERGYESSGIYNLDTLLNGLDYYIIEEQTEKQVLVIEEDHENNSDFPIFHYLGQKEVYDDFLNDYVKKEYESRDNTLQKRKSHKRSNRRK